jgi:hypothetical protein
MDMPLVEGKTSANLAGASAICGDQAFGRSQFAGYSRRSTHIPQVAARASRAWHGAGAPRTTRSKDRAPVWLTGKTRRHRLILAAQLTSFGGFAHGVCKLAVFHASIRPSVPPDKAPAK